MDFESIGIQLACGNAFVTHLKVGFYAVTVLKTSQQQDGSSHIQPEVMVFRQDDIENTIKKHQAEIKGLEMVLGKIVNTVE